MINKQYTWDDLGVSAEMSLFVPNHIADPTDNGCEECHAMFHVEPRGELFDGQLSRLCWALHRVSGLADMQGMKPVFRRFFLSDATNQLAALRAHRSDGSVTDAFSACTCATSFIQQPPLDGSKLALWIYFQKGSSLSAVDDVVVAEHNGYRHLYKWGMTSPAGDSYSQTQSLLDDYESVLSHFGGATIEANCIRTWFFVRDVDTQYAGMVRARRENFIAQGLTPQTHYVSSTGIGGVPADPQAIVQFDTYAVTGFAPQQQRYLYAPTHLNPTYQYGVTFERGTVFEYGDRAEIYISGTASINNKGEVLHVGDIVRQTERMWENVATLLAEGNASFSDVAQIIVYLRDMADYPVVYRMFDERFPGIPRVITLAPVCRPTWLIEMECIAIPHRQNDGYRSF